MQPRSVVTRAMLLDAPGKPLRLAERTLDPGEDRVLIRVRACGVCRTDLHVRDGDLAPSRLPIVLGHEVVGTVMRSAGGFEAGERVGVPWLGFTCGRCPHCAAGRENLCDEAKFHGLDLDGGFAEHMAADPRFVFRIPDAYEDVEAAPLLCAPASSDTARSSSPARAGNWASTASARPRTSSSRSRSTRAARCTRS